MEIEDGDKGHAGEVGIIVEDAVSLRKKFGKNEVFWMQLGIINEDATVRAMKAGFEVVMDRCMEKEHEKLHGKTKT